MLDCLARCCWAALGSASTVPSLGSFVVVAVALLLSAEDADGSVVDMFGSESAAAGTTRACIALSCFAANCIVEFGTCMLGFLLSSLPFFLVLHYDSNSRDAQVDSDRPKNLCRTAMPKKSIAAFLPFNK